MKEAVRVEYPARLWVVFDFSFRRVKDVLYVVIAAIVVTLLAVSAAAMVWDPRRRAESDEYEYEYEYDMDEDVTESDEYARRRGVEWPRKQSV
ncbi:DUF1634 domain-containing protein [Nocardia gipuzkoensis]|uniref:DUF1634 domain-containing protein n=1 Tax=Nocardia gipuzkoensis TaxID=2749991 RepID=UPI00237EDEBF|nr:DUF1634 domain-containing protein [Nocardia gipuzkoensis]MDE1670908.1 DUF1634 domain-containing protein [Nocardia gipuzkoensis]